MRIRTLAGMVLVPVLVAVFLLVPHFVTALVVGIMAAIASYEMLYRTGLVRSIRLNAYSAVMAFLVCIWAYFDNSYPAALLGMLLYYIALFGEMMFSSMKLSIKSAALCMFSGVVVPFMFSSMLRILMAENGKFFIMIPFVMAFLSDTGAYFVGVFFGKHKLCPHISPKKTVEGFVGGIVTAVVGMLVYALILQKGFLFEVDYSIALLYGLLGSLCGVFGDLSMSVIKRQVGIKDYGNLIPGHGGILDRFDSVLITAPLTEVLLLLLPLV